jgi:uncharacterized protein (DUF2336 family)
MSAPQSLLCELEDAIQGGSRAARIETLRRITDLFLTGADQFNEEQIGVFDDVLGHLVERIETRARIELAKRLAPVEQAPPDVINRLARDDEIAVAGPVLTQSKRLSTADLVEIAQSKGQSHLLAIASRDSLEDRVTDVLIDRGDGKVMHTLAANTGAAFSREGYATMVKRAEADESLLVKIGRRLDIPAQLFRELLLRATQAVRERLLASASDEARATIKRVLAEASEEVAREAPMRHIADAQRLISLMHETGRLNDAEVLTFARTDKFDEVVAAIATMTGAPFEMIDRVMCGGRTDAALVPCKAAALGWPTVRSILEMRGSRLAAGEHDIESASAEYARLSASTAQRVLRFWQVRQSTSGQAPAV